MRADVYKMEKHYANLLLASEEAEKARDEGTFPFLPVLLSFMQMVQDLQSRNQ